jgi:hypothetical protein
MRRGQTTRGRETKRTRCLQKEQRTIGEIYSQRSEYSTTECRPDAKSEARPECPLRNRTESVDGKNDTGVRRLG